MKKRKVLILAMILVIALIGIFILYPTWNSYRSLKGRKVVFEYGGGVQIYDSKENTTSILLRRVQSNGSLNSHSVSYSQPALSPDEKKIISVKTYSTGESYGREDLVVVDLEKNLQTVLYSVSESKMLLGSPIWSLDGNCIYFLGNDILYRFEISKMNMTELAKIPISEKIYIYDRFYARIEKTGQSIIVLCPMNKYRGYAIYDLNLTDRTLKEIFSSESSGEMRDSNMLKLIYDKFDTNMFEAIFGSRDYPVFEPNYSADRRFYYFVIKKNGLFAKHWLGAYDKKNHKSIDLKVLYRDLYAE
jgi:hypothetical protein